MGIKGLMTYMETHSERYLRPFQLHDSYLVIDGNTISCQLYIHNIKCNCLSGGDYDTISRSVSEFFDELKKCNVTPLVIWDGAVEKKKIRTMEMRWRDKLHQVANVTPHSQRKKTLFPQMMNYVFMDVLNAKGIKYARTMYEADGAIAAVAKILDCPVLSSHSDFYIFGSSYIPLKTLIPGVIKRKNNTGYAKTCKIYKSQYLIPNSNCDKRLPLFAMLIGNDYVKRSWIEKFYANLKVRKNNASNREQCIIEAVLNWVQERTFEHALSSILSTIPKCERQKTVDIIEMVINGYLQSPSCVLKYLDVPKEHYKQDITSVTKKFKYMGDINNLEHTEEAVEGSESNTSAMEDDEDNEYSNDLNDSNDENELTTLPLPNWFVEEYFNAKLPAYLLTLILHKRYFTIMAIEDFSQPPAIFTSAELFQVLFGLLIPSRQRQHSCIRYMSRGKDTETAYRKVQFTKDLIYRLPCLDSLRIISLDDRRTILNKTLAIESEFFDNVPSDWQLYLAAIVFCGTREQNVSSFLCHIYALLLCMLFHIIDNNIGCYRRLEEFRQVYGDLATKNKTKCQKKNATDNSIAELCKCITKDDCLFAAPFFIQNLHEYGNIFTGRTKFIPSIVHFFSVFQHCASHIWDLNALLGKPYEHFVIGNLYNGTFLYNLVVNLQQRRNIDTYITTTLKQSPSLLQLFNALVHKVKCFMHVSEDHP